MAAPPLKAAAQPTTSVALAPNSLEKMVVFSFNIWMGGSGRFVKAPIPKDYTVKDLEAIWEQMVELIETHKADTVLMQEVDCRTERCKSVYVPEKICELLRKKQPFWFSNFYKAKNSNKGQYGLANLSHVPHISCEFYNLGNIEPKQENRVAICETYRLHKGTLKVKLAIINVHLGLLKVDQEHQLDILMKKIDKISPKRPVLICGDFNISASGSEVVLDRSGLMDILKRSRYRKFSDLEPTHQVTFPGNASKIDYALFSDAVFDAYKNRLTCKCEVIKANHCSDHHALKITVQLNEPPNPATLPPKAKNAPK